MTTLKEFEDALRESGNEAALTILDALRRRDKARRTLTPARRVTGRKMTPELAREILSLHGSTTMTQQEIAFKLGVNQGRVNEVIKRGKWLTDDPSSPEAVMRDRALERIEHTVPASMMPATPAPQAATSAPVAEPAAQPAPELPPEPAVENLVETAPVEAETVLPVEEPALFDDPAAPVVAAPAEPVAAEPPEAPAAKPARRKAAAKDAAPAKVADKTDKTDAGKPAAPKGDSRQLSLGDF